MNNNRYRMSRNRYRVERNSRKGYDVIDRATDALVEGGFFYRDSADAACAQWNRDAASREAQLSSDRADYLADGGCPMGCEAFADADSRCSECNNG